MAEKSTEPVIINYDLRNHAGINGAIQNRPAGFLHAALDSAPSTRKDIGEFDVLQGWEARESSISRRNDCKAQERSGTHDLSGVSASKVSTLECTQRLASTRVRKPIGTQIPSRSIGGRGI